MCLRYAYKEFWSIFLFFNNINVITQHGLMDFSCFISQNFAMRGLKNRSYITRDFYDRSKISSPIVHFGVTIISDLYASCQKEKYKVIIERIGRKTREKFILLIHQWQDHCDSVFCLGQRKCDAPCTRCEKKERHPFLHRHARRRDLRGDEFRSEWQFSDVERCAVEK